MKHMVLVLSGVVMLVAWATVGSSGDSTGHRFLNLPGRSDELPFSHAVLAGETLYVSGGLGIDPRTGTPPDDIEQEIRIVLDGMQQKLKLAGMDMDDLVRVQVFCPDLSLYGRFNDVYRTYFRDSFPARAFIGSGPLLLGAHFEVMGTAVKQP